MQPVVGRKTVFQGRVVQVDLLDVDLGGGRRAAREVVCHRGAATVLGQRPDGRFVLVRQHRPAVAETLIEAMAGCIDPGESPEACARREMREETGYEVVALERLGEVTACPGYSSERLHLFFARLAAQPGAPQPDAGEDVEPVVLDRREIEAAIASGRIHDSKTLAIWLLWTIRHGNAA